MINISRSILIKNGQAPYGYTWVTNNPCVVFDTPSGTTNGPVNTVVSFSDQTCLQGASVSLTVVDANGCSNSIPVTFVDVCNGLSASINLQMGISTTGEPLFTYIPVAVGGTGQYTYKWFYDTTLLEKISDTKNLVAKLKKPATSVTVKLVVADSNGCEIEVMKTQTLCAPTISNSTTQGCRDLASNFVYLGQRILSARTCPNQPINWSSAEFTTPAGVTATIDSTVGNNAWLNIAVDTAILTNLDFTIDWTVRDQFGIISNSATITVNLVTCATGNMIGTVPYSFTLPCNPELPYSTKFDLDSPSAPYIVSSCPINWSSFSFVPQVGQTLVSPTQLTTPYGSVILTMDHEIKYTQTSAGTGTLVVAYQVSNTCVPILSTGVTYAYFNLTCIEAPVTDNLTICSSCEVPFTITPVITSGVVDPATVTITSGPYHGMAIVDPIHGTIIYTADPGYSGADQITYQVSGYNADTTSNESTITISVICAGIDGLAQTCN